MYVDDLLLSGPTAEHAPFWATLGAKVDIEPPTSLDRFLGRHHEFAKDGRSVVFNMSDYCRSAVELYLSHVPGKTLKKASTPFVPEGSLHPRDDDVKGELGGSACAILMKDLWLARLSRPDIQRAICYLASHVSKWSVNDDKKLHRLMCYLNSTPNLHLGGYCRDPPDKLELQLWVDADFSGETDDAKSTSGAFLALIGPNTFFPLMWASKKQTSTSRSTTEAEVVSLAQALFAEAIPTLDLWDLILGRSVTCRFHEDNQATKRVVEKGYSPKLRHILRTHKVNLSSIKEILDLPEFELDYCSTDDMIADIFTKALVPAKWDHAIALLRMTDKSVNEASGLKGPPLSANTTPSAKPSEAAARGGAPARVKCPCCTADVTNTVITRLQKCAPRRDADDCVEKVKGGEQRRVTFSAAKSATAAPAATKASRQSPAATSGWYIFSHPVGQHCDLRGGSQKSPGNGPIFGEGLGHTVAYARQDPSALRGPLGPLG